MLENCSVKEYMSTHVVSVNPEENVFSAIQVLLDNNISGAPVVDKSGKMIGILSERDCLPIILHDKYYGDVGEYVKDFMVTVVKTVRMDDNIIDVAECFSHTHYRRFPVVDEHQKLVGLISRRDILKAIFKLHNKI